ncbi:MAG: glycerate 2-kinase [Thermoproteota archaeon]|nr:glycerate 2-kinase [Thermoproteota archaeon]
MTFPVIRNFEKIIENGANKLDAEARKVALLTLESALSAVNPRNLVSEKVRFEGNVLEVGGFRLNLDDYSRILVVGGGKASGRMAEALEEKIGKRIEAGILNILKGTSNEYKTGIIELNEASHPIPDEGGLRGVEKIKKLLSTVDKKTLVVCLISGGGSAILPSPQRGISLEEKQQTTSLLLKSGATIDEINVIRKHISAIKGGRLAAMAYPATLLCLLLSDVVGDPLPTIASGPTVPDPSTFQDSIEVLKRYDIWQEVPETVRRYLTGGVEGINPESPKPGDPCFSKVHNIILGNNRVALEAAEKKAVELGLNHLIISSYIEGEARHIGTVFAAIAKEINTADRPLARSGIVLAGGETTVTVSGSGKGGRNQEIALSASLRLDNLRGVALASIGTDGLDGSSDAAGAIIDGSTLKRALEAGIDPRRYLGENDSYHFFKALNDTILTGPTGTNVNDIIVLVNLKGGKKRIIE